MQPSSSPPPARQEISNRGDHVQNPILRRTFAPAAGPIEGLLVSVIVVVKGTSGLNQAADHIRVQISVAGWDVGDGFRLLIGFGCDGQVSELGSRWGLVRHEWVLFKLILKVVATLFCCCTPGRWATSLTLLEART
jgi:hypothetical protein